MTARIAPVQAVLRAIGLATYRELRSFHSITGQNFFYLVLLIAFQQPESASFFGILVGAMLFFPLSSDPLEKVPAVRRQLWPMGREEWIAIRIVSLFLSPVLWIGIFILVRIGWRLAYQLALVGLAANAISYAMKRWTPGLNLLRFVPAPPGVTGQLMRLHWREMLTTLDPYVGLLLSAATTLYRVSGGTLPPDATPILSMIVVITLSTSAQVLIGLDGAGAQRYKLTPLAGWRVLLAKDLAFMIMLTILIAPLEIPAGFTAGLAALAIGHYQSVLQPVAEKRWRFTSGVMWPVGAFQMFAIFALGNAVLKFGPAVIAATLALWFASLLWFGRKVVNE